MRKLFILTLIFLLTACGAPAAATPAPAATEAPALPFLSTITPIVPEVQPFGGPLASPRPSEAPALNQPGPTRRSVVATKTLIPTLTPFPTATRFVPTPTDTLLPPLELPTERPFLPSRVPWTGLPTYEGDSEPGLLFRVDYDPDVWAQTEGNFGEIVLAHRVIEYCTITPWSGRGLPMDWKVEHEFRTIGAVDFDVSTITTAQGQVQFVTYVGGDRRVLTGFQVTFEGRGDECLQAAEAIFATLHSLAAIPTATPMIVVESPTP